MANTTTRAVRVDDETWQNAMTRAAAEHRTVSDVIRVALRAYAAEQYDATEPPRRKKRSD